MTPSRETAEASTPKFERPLIQPLSPSEIPTGLWAQLRRNIPSYVVGVGFLAGYNYCQYWFDLLLADAINGVLERDYAIASAVGLTMLGAAVLAFGSRVISRLTIFNAGRHAEYELRTALLERLHRLGPSFYAKVSTGDIMSRVTNDLQQVRAMLGFGVLNLFNTGFALISALAVMLQFSSKLTVAALVPLPMLLLVMRAYAKVIYTRQRDNQEALGDLSSQVQSSMAGVRVVRSFSLEQAELERFDKENERYLDRALSLAKLRGSMWPVMASVTQIGVLVVFWYGGRLMVSGELEPQYFLPFYRALYRLTWPLAALGFLVSIVQRGRAGYSRLQDVFQAEPDVVGGLATLPRTEGALRIRGLSFDYGSNNGSSGAVLRDLDLDIRAGERVAIVGRTGAGKSTLAALLVRLQRTPRGSIFLDGVDICALPLETLRSSVLYAQQTPFLFSTTVGRNVGYLLDDPDGRAGQETIEHAAAEAQVRNEISELPQGFDTVVGERGVQLSGGQKQRVALARALVAQPRVLVLDDPLSAVDARTENALIDALERHRRDATLLLITHRVSAAQRCDRVVVLDEGRIVESGTHAELAQANGLYARFVEEQRREGELEELQNLQLPSLHTTEAS